MIYTSTFLVVRSVVPTVVTEEINELDVILVDA
jgi:hypothetical protein